MRTTFASQDEFVRAYQAYCEDSHVFAPTEKSIVAGSQCAFSIELVDGTPMLRGLGVTTELLSTNDRFGRAGVIIAIDQLTTASEPILEQLHAARAAADGATTTAGRKRPSPMTHQMWGSAVAPATAEMEAQDEITDVGPPPTPNARVTRELRSPTPTAAPNEVHDDKASSTSKYEGLPVPPGRASTVTGIGPALEAAATATTEASDPPTDTPAVDRLVATRGDRTPPPTPPAAMRRATPRPETLDATGMAELDDSGSMASIPPPWWRNGRIAGVFAAGILLGLLFSFVVRPAGSSSTPRAPQVAAAEPTQCPPVEVAAAEPEPDDADDSVLVEEPAPVAPARKPGVAKRADHARKPVELTKVAAASKPSLAPATRVSSTKTTPAPAPSTKTAARSAIVATMKPGAPTTTKVTTKTSSSSASLAVARTTSTTRPTGAPSPSSARVTTPAAKTSITPTATTKVPTKTSVATTTRSAPATNKPTMTTKPPVAVATTTKPTIATKAATATKAPATTTKATVVATTAKSTSKPARAKPAKRKGGCSTLDCI